MRHIHHQMVYGPLFNVEYWRGDDVWSASIHLNFKWFGKYYWHCWFLPW